MLISQLILLIVAVYIAIGACIAVPFVLTGVSTVDHAARGAPWLFRVLILPGSIALWPVVLAKWRAARLQQGSSR